MQSIQAGLTENEAVQRVSAMLQRDFPQLKGQLEAKVQKTSQAQEPTPEPEPAPADVPPASSPAPDVPDSSPEEPEAPVEELSNKEHNFAQLRAQLAEKDRLLKAARGELRDARQQRSEQKREAVIDAVLASERPQDFAEWEPERQQAFISAEAAKAELRNHLGDDAVSELRQVVLENRITKAIPGLSAEQIEAVGEVMHVAAALEPPEALVVAASRQPSLFPAAPPAEPAPAPSMPASHRVQEPSRSGNRRAPEPEKKASLTEVVANAQGGVQGRKKAAANAIAQLMGRS